MYTKKFYVHEIAAVDLSRIYFLKNAKIKFKPNNRDLNRDWNISNMDHWFLYISTHKDSIRRDVDTQTDMEKSPSNSWISA